MTEERNALSRPPEHFETARLRLRPPHADDAAAMFSRWAQDTDVTRYLVWTPHRHVGESSAHITRCLAGWNAGTSFVWFLESRETGELLGSIAARGGMHGVNLGYLLAKDAWGRGYMVEALEPVVAWFLSQADVHRVWATCDVENRASARVLEKAGFELEGVLRQWDHHPNVGPGRRDALCYSRTVRTGAARLTSDAVVRPMTSFDWPAVRRIWAEGIETGQATFETAVSEWEPWDRGHLIDGRLVAVRQNEIVGWAALSPVSTRAVYRGVAEVSVYIAAAARGQGVGRLLLDALIAESEIAGLWTLQAAVFPENHATIRLHRSCGFREVGRRQRIGRHHGRWRDTVLLERRSTRIGLD